MRTGSNSLNVITRVVTASSQPPATETCHQGSRRNLSHSAYQAQHKHYSAVFHEKCGQFPCIMHTYNQDYVSVVGAPSISYSPSHCSRCCCCHRIWNTPELCGRMATDACLTAIPGVASSIPARSHTFVEIDHEIISTVILLSSADSFKKGCCQLQAKVCARITG